MSEASALGRQLTVLGRYLEGAPTVVTLRIYSPSGINMNVCKLREQKFTEIVRKLLGSRSKPSRDLL